MQIAILEPEGFSPRAMARLGDLGAVRVFQGGNRSSFLAAAEVLFVRLGHHIGGEVLASAPLLRFVCSPTTGHTHLDEPALEARQVQVISLRGETDFLERIRATPEHTLGLLIALVRRYVSAFQHPANAHWDRDRCRGEEIAGMRVGLIGLGRVGRRVATYLDALGAEIHYTDPAASVFPRNYVRHASALELVKACRAVLLLASHTRNTPPILGRREIDALAGRYLVNTARGELVDEIALLEAIEGGRLAGCAVDVIADETGLSRRSRWLDATTAANVIVTPHIGGATVTSMHLTEEFVVEKLASRLSGGASR